MEVSRIGTRIGMSLFMLIMLFFALVAWTGAVSAQEATEEPELPASIVVTGDDTVVTVDDAEPDPLAPLTVILAGIAGLMSVFVPVVNSFAERYQLPDWADDLIKFVLAFGLALVALYNVPTGINIFSLAGYENFNANIAIVVTAVGMAFGADVLRLIYNFLRSSQRAAK